MQETETIWTDDSLPFDLFSEDWDEILTMILSQKHYFNSFAPITEAALELGEATDETPFQLAINELMNRGILEKGRGG